MGEHARARARQSVDAAGGGVHQSERAGSGAQTMFTDKAIIWGPYGETRPVWDCQFGLPIRPGVVPGGQLIGSPMAYTWSVWAWGSL